jgi:hypothetical protein
MGALPGDAEKLRAWVLHQDTAVNRQSKLAPRGRLKLPTRAIYGQRSSTCAWGTRRCLWPP